MSAAGLIRFRGAAVTFSRTTMAYDVATGLSTPTTTTVAGYAMHVTNGVAKQFDAQLVTEEEVTLEFMPTTAAEVPALESSVVFGAYTYTVTKVTPIAPAGTATRSLIVVTR